LRAQGKAMMEAVVEAATLRLRPILMTTGAMVLGALPLALAAGAGAESRTQIGWVIVGGMFPRKRFRTTLGRNPSARLREVSARLPRRRSVRPTPGWLTSSPVRRLPCSVASLRVSSRG
jgi:hypothetical protein